MQQNRDLREQSYYGPAMEPARRVTPMMEGCLLHRGCRCVFRGYFDGSTMWKGCWPAWSEGVADAAGVTRVGIFSKIRPGDRYCLRAGLRCLPETNEIEYRRA